MTALRYLLQTLFPELCLHCGKKIADGEFLCRACFPDGQVKRPTNVAAEPAAGNFQKQFIFAYDGIGKTLFTAAKFTERRRAVQFFIRHSRESLQTLSSGSTLVLALPSKRNFLRRLLKAAVPKEKLVFDAFSIKSTRGRQNANKLLGEADRYKRISESLLWNSSALAGRMPHAERYILCDDVSTTGATLNQAAYLVQKNLGIRKEHITLWALMYREREFIKPL